MIKNLGKKSFQTFKIILNTPIRKDLLINKFNRSSDSEILICTDGGVNRLHALFKDNEEREKYTPNFIIGDFDSAKGQNLDYYQKRGS
jgi:thiamine pyrophosphokinase